MCNKMETKPNNSNRCNSSKKENNINNKPKNVIIMAIVNKGILDGFSGAVGTVVGSKWNGRYVMRSRAIEVKNANTEEQVKQRNFFKELGKATRGISKEMLRALYPTEVTGLSRRNLLSRQIAACAVNEGDTKTLDFSRIVSLGNGPDGAGSLQSATVTDTTAVTLPWDVSEIEYDAGNSNAIIVLFNQTHKAVTLVNTNVLVEAETATLNLKGFAQAGDQLYYYATVATKGKVSTRGFGSFIIKTRAEK